MKQFLGTFIIRVMKEYKNRTQITVVGHSHYRDTWKIMDQLKHFIVWCSIATAAFVDSNGKSISTTSSTFLDNLRNRRSLAERPVKVQLPKSMTNGRILSELIQSDQLELILNSSKLFGTECPDSYTQLPVNAPVYARSNCPWYYQLRHNPDRFPASLPVAVSKCKRQCLGLHDDVTDDFICEYVYQDVTVLMKDYHNTISLFVEKVERIPVGSTCVRKYETT